MVILPTARVPIRRMSTPPKFPLEFLQLDKNTDNVFWIFSKHLCCVSVPSSEPLNVTLKNLKFDEVMVQWDPIPEHTANGILLGYRVYLYQYGYWYYSLTNTVNTSSSSIFMVKLRGLKAVHKYRISVAAFTSKGAGPQSYWRYITTGTIHF